MHSELCWKLKEAFQPVSPEKITKASPFQYLGKIIKEHAICPQKPEARKYFLKILDNFQE